MAHLGRALARLFPNLPQVYPQWNGQPLLTWMADPRAFAGYIGHYHVTNNKWDPGCFDFKWLAQKIRTSSTWFVCLDKNNECPRRPRLPKTRRPPSSKAKSCLSQQRRGSDGRLLSRRSVWRSRLWHGGIH
jgi:hypothetical protein